MAQHPSAQKRVRQSLRRKTFKNQYKGQVKALQQAFLSSIAKKDSSQAKKNLEPLMALLDKTCQKGYFHKNKSSRKKSAFCKKLHSLSS